MKLDKKKLSKKLQEIIEQKGWEKFQDVHIDDVCNNYKENYNVSMGINALIVSRELITDDLELLLAISLKERFNLKKIKELNLDKFETFADNNPVSIYVYPIGYFPFEESIRMSTLFKIPEFNNLKFYFRNDDSIAYVKF